MKSRLIIYTIQRFGFRARQFLEHWYIIFSKKYWHSVINQIEKLDYKLALKITLRHIFEPLYKDYSLVGYVLGFLFRSLRILLALTIYTLILISAGILYVFWLLIPPIIIYNAIIGYSI